MPRGKRNGEDLSDKKQRPPEEAGPGHNSALTEAEQRFLLIEHMAAIKAARAKVASATSAVRDLYKKAKAHGVSKKDIDFALSLDGGDEAAQIERRRREAQIARWLLHPIGTQSDLFETHDGKPLIEAAKDEGEFAALRGEACEVPAKHAGGPGQQPWIEGWHQGNAFRQERLERTRAELESPDAMLIKGVGEAPPPLGPEQAAIQ